MRKSWSLALTLLATTGPAVAETVTVTTTLRERGFAEGFLLSGRQASSLYLPLPAGTEVTNLRIGMKARAVAPNLQRGSVVIIVNGQPVDALRLNENPRAQIARLDTAVNRGEAFRAPAMDLRFRADLIAHAAICTDEFDPANTLQILPETAITYDVDLDAITTLRDALALLPGQPAVELTLPLTPKASAAALQLSTMLTNEGYRARFTAIADAEGPASLRLVAPSGDGAIRLVHEKGALRIQVPENADLAAFGRLWQGIPSALAGGALRVESTGVAGNGAGSTAPFLRLPGPLRVVQTGEMGFDFPLVDGSGRPARQARLNLIVAPDWSNANPVISLYLNGQLIAASRADIGENILSASLPPDLLQISNRLTVTVDRAQVVGYCPGPNPGHAVQLLPGTQINYDGDPTGGFAAIAGALRSGGTLVLPETAKGAEGFAYLTLASRILTGLGLGAAPMEVMFGADIAPVGPVMTMAPSGSEGLVLPVGQPELTLSTDQPLASVTVDASRQRLDVRVLEGQRPPNPVGVYLGSGSAALIGSEGVIWQDTPTSRRPSVVQRAREVSQGLVQVLRGEGAFWGLIGLATIIIVVLARALLKRFFDRRASR